jgi:hypothetical protein
MERASRQEISSTRLALRQELITHMATVPHFGCSPNNVLDRVDRTTGTGN